MPIVYLLIGKAIEDNLELLKAILLAVLLIASQLVSERVFWTLPDYPVESPTPLPLLSIPSSDFQLLDLWSMHGECLIETISLAQYLLLCTLLLWWLSNQASGAKGDDA